MNDIWNSFYFLFTLFSFLFNFSFISLNKLVCTQQESLKIMFPPRIYKHAPVLSLFPPLLTWRCPCFSQPGFPLLPLFLSPSVTFSGLSHIQLVVVFLPSVFLIFKQTNPPSPLYLSSWVPISLFPFTRKLLSMLLHFLPHFPRLPTHMLPFLPLLWNCLSGSVANSVVKVSGHISILFLLGLLQHLVKLTFVQFEILFFTGLLWPYSLQFHMYSTCKYQSILSFFTSLPFFFRPTLYLNASSS